MRKVGLRPPADDMRPTRRSLVELTAAASRAVDDGVLAMPEFPIAGATADVSRPEDAASPPPPTAAPKQAMASHVMEPAEEPLRRPAALPDTPSTAEMLVEIVKDHQARALDNFRLGLGAMLDYAKDRAKVPMPADDGAPDGGARPGDNRMVAAGAAAEYRAETVEIVKTHAATTLGYARELASATSAAEFVELSSALARKQCELMLKQAAALQSFGRRLTKPGGSSEDG
jgi:hypothetical protein